MYDILRTTVTSYNLYFEIRVRAYSTTAISLVSKLCMSAGKLKIDIVGNSNRVVNYYYKGLPAPRGIKKYVISGWWILHHILRPKDKANTIDRLASSYFSQSICMSRKRSHGWLLSTCWVNRQGHPLTELLRARAHNCQNVWDKKGTWLHMVELRGL
jgi:hypothetical protein